MKRRTATLVMASWCFGLGTNTLGADPAGVDRTPASLDPVAVLPLAQITPELQTTIAEVIQLHHFHHKGTADTFPCFPKVYLSLLNDPALTLALWQDLSPSPARLQVVGPGSYQGTDGNGTSANWQFAYRSPRLHVLYGTMNYRSPRGAAHLEGRLVLIVRSNYFKESNGNPWIQHEIEAFVKIDSKGWRAVARTVKPVIERLLENQIQEAGWFVSLMGRLVENYPDWAVEVASRQAFFNPQARQEFEAILAENRHPQASSGRPVLAEESGQSVSRR